MDERKRPLLDFGDGDVFAAPPAVAAETIKSVTRQAGFRPTPPVVDPDPVTSPGTTTPRAAQDEPQGTPLRRRQRGRPRTGRVHTFSVRITAETNNEIYDYAERHGLVLGEVLERAMMALRAKDQAGG